MIYLEQLRQLILRLTVRQRILIGAVALLVICGLFGLRHWQTERNFKALFHNVSAEDAGLVLAKLKESAVEVRLENGGKTIKVPADRVDELRIQMASAGLPKTGRIGFELFDKPNFGTSEFAEQVNYHRAVEGELERSVMAIQEVESARVHITFPRQSLFLENRQPAKASVLLKLKPEAALSKQNIQAISHLASSAVDGLTPENVSVLDMRGNLLSKPAKAGDGDGESNKELTEYRERMEKALLEKVRATLEPLVGPDGFRAAVSLECDLASGDQSEESFDPARSVMVNSQRSEDGSSTPTAAGVPGAASNLPRPTSRPGGGATPLFRRSENVTYQTSRVIRHIKFPHGMVKRLSASVLLDHAVKINGGRRTVEPPPPEQLRAIKDIVSAAVGFQQERGDQIIVEALVFENTRNLTGVPGEAPVAAARPRLLLPAWVPDWFRVPMEGHLNWLVGQSWFPAIVVLLVAGLLYGLYRGLGALGRRAGGLARLIASKTPLGKKAKGQHVDVTLDPALEGAPPVQQIEGAAAKIEEAARSLQEQLREREQVREQLTNDALLELGIAKADVRRADVLARHISDLATKDPQAVANLMRTWTAEKGGT